MVVGGCWLVMGTYVYMDRGNGHVGVYRGMGMGMDPDVDVAAHLEGRLPAEHATSSWKSSMTTQRLDPPHAVDASASALGRACARIADHQAALHLPGIPNHPWGAGRGQASQRLLLRQLISAARRRA